MVRTGVFVTQEEFDEVQALAARARSTPVIAFSSKHALEEGGLLGQAWTRVVNRINELAEKYNLPPVPGDYGIDVNRELLSA